MDDNVPQSAVILVYNERDPTEEEEGSEAQVWTPQIHGLRRWRRR